MADPTTYYFDKPQKLTFTKNSFACPRTYAQAFMWWLPPGCTAILQAYVPPLKDDRAPAANDVLHWNATGSSRTFKGLSGTQVEMHGTGAPPAPHLWGPGFSTQNEIQYMQLGFPKVVPSTNHLQLNGKWEEGTMLDINTSQTATYETDASNNFTKWSGFNHFLNVMSEIYAIGDLVGFQVKPQELVYEQEVFNTNCISAGDLDVQTEGFTTIRTELIEFPSDLINYRSTPPQVFNCGFIAFGYR